jgi:LacI family transcriptional regulator
MRNQKGVMRITRVASLTTRHHRYGRDTVRGLIRYAFPSRRWLFVGFPDPDLFRRFRVRGAIGLFTEANALAALRSLDIPIVSTLNAMAEAADLPRVGPDDEAVGRMAAAYFIERGYTTFLFVRRLYTPYSDVRGAAFTAAVAAAGHSVHRLEFAEDNDYDRNVIAWLRDLPKPLAIFGADDEMARHMSDMCLQADVNVPQEAALLGVDNDELACTESYVPISSIELPAETIGFEAARLLDRLMRGRARPRAPLLLPPTRVVTRASSDVTAITDPDVTAALRFIRENSDRPISVADVADATMVGRRTIELRFRKVLGRTVLHEIEHERIERAKQLLARTDLRLPDVAAGAGFVTRLRLHRAFQRLVGTTPDGYRSRYRFR